MAGHVQDRWYRNKLDPDTGNIMVGRNGRPVKEQTPEHGKGMRYKVHYYDDAGKERNKSFPDKQKGKAEEYLLSMQHDVLSGVFTDPEAGKVLFRDFAAKVLKGRSQDESTVEIIRQQTVQHVHPFLGDTRLSSFNNDLIRDWLSWMTERVDSKGNPKVPAASYRAQIFDTVSSILDVAVSEKRIRANPCKDKSISRPKPVPRKIKVWADARLRSVGLALPERFKPMTALGAGVGLRQGEIFAFTLDDVDRDRMVYHVNRQAVTVNGKVKFKLPKGHKTRVVPLGRGVLADLDDYAENFPPVAVTLPWAEDDSRKTETVNLLMVNKHGGLYARQTFNNTIWKPTFGKAGLDYTQGQDGMHALRHLFASHMLAQGVSIKELAAFLGHASEAFTLRVYAHLMPDSYDRARLAIDHLFKPRLEAAESDATALDKSGDGLATVHGLTTA
ncbi:tyrosine-type recombinase/integrase [Lentzea albidocapillata]|uniref:Site-specific recombinase XerD n=1 Tax=Lentzea albidocapillata TaxID=40571 RepID=A0A1W2FTY6_9PSEU|nr:site-specific integrase [Lentzea albidocapillata]SMD25068.1 Site-specific recombinase XerD [Lentzea albidocapillata]